MKNNEIKTKNIKGKLVVGRLYAGRKEKKTNYPAAECRVVWHNDSLVFVG